METLKNISNYFRSELFKFGFIFNFVQLSTLIVMSPFLKYYDFGRESIKDIIVSLFFVSCSLHATFFIMHSISDIGICVADYFLQNMKCSKEGCTGKRELKNEGRVIRKYCKDCYNEVGKQ